MTIYLDYQATTPVDPRVLEAMMPYFTTHFGNPSSSDHVIGDTAERVVKRAKEQVAALVDALPKEVYFTSGATEALNLVLQGMALSVYPQPIHIALMPIEHKAVLDTCIGLSKRYGAVLHWIPVDSRGRIDLESIHSICQKGIHLLAVMAAHNEIGNIYPIREIAKLARDYKIPFLVDGSQAVGKIPLSFQNEEIDFLVFSSHKIYGPKGVGALVMKKNQTLEPLLFGGGQQNGFRPGTLNVPGIVGLGMACELRQNEMEKDEEEIRQKRNWLWKELEREFPNMVVNGDLESRLAGNLHFSIPGILNEAVIARIRHKLAISTGSACNSGMPGPSYVLEALNLPREIQDGAFRISIGKFTTWEELEEARDIFCNAVHEVMASLLR